MNLPRPSPTSRRRSHAIPAWLPDSWYNTLLHLAVLRRFPNLHRPRTLNDKLLWLKLHYRDPLLKRCSDKATVRDYITERVGAEVCPPIIGIYERLSDVPFAALPDAYVLKASHGSGWNLFVEPTNPLPHDTIVQTVSSWLTDDYSRYAREDHYRGLTPRMVIEPLLRNAAGRVPDDIKIDCMNGEPRLIMLHIDRFGDYRQVLLTPDWQQMPIRWRYPWPETLPPRPAQLAEILDIARRLAAPFPYVRIDGYLIDGRFRVGELTFTPDRGVRMLQYRDDLALGALLTLPDTAAAAQE